MDLQNDQRPSAKTSGWKKGSPLQKEPFHDPAEKGIHGLVEWGLKAKNGVKNAKDAKIAKMHVFVHFAKIPL